MGRRDAEAWAGLAGTEEGVRVQVVPRPTPGLGALSSVPLELLPFQVLLRLHPLRPCLCPSSGCPLGFQAPPPGSLRPFLLQLVLSFLIVLAADLSEFPVLLGMSQFHLEQAVVNSAWAVSAGPALRL